MNEELEISQVQVEPISSLEAEERAVIDTQISTAKKYPRSIKRSTDNAIAIATMDKETAESCGYALKRGDKIVRGASVHLAKMVASEWGNLRIQAKVTQITSTQIVSEAVCFDLEKNIAVKVEVRKKITDKYNKRYNEDMITMTGNATNAIALRNSIFAVIPHQVVNKVYLASRDLIAGDLKDEVKLIKKRTDVLAGFRDTYGVDEKEVLSFLGINTINQIKVDEIQLLIDTAQSIKDGDTTVDFVFGRNEKTTKQGENALKVAESIEAELKGKKGKEPKLEL